MPDFEIHVIIISWCFLKEKHIQGATKPAEKVSTCLSEVPYTKHTASAIKTITVLSHFKTFVGDLRLRKHAKKMERTVRSMI